MSKVISINKKEYEEKLNRAKLISTDIVAAFNDNDVELEVAEMACNLILNYIKWERERCQE